MAEVVGGRGGEEKCWADSSLGDRLYRFVSSDPHIDPGALTWRAIVFLRESIYLKWRATWPYLTDRRGTDQKEELWAWKEKKPQNVNIKVGYCIVSSLMFYIYHVTEQEQFTFASVIHRPLETLWTVIV